MISSIWNSCDNSRFPLQTAGVWTHRYEVYENVTVRCTNAEFIQREKSTQVWNTSKLSADDMRDIALGHVKMQGLMQGFDGSAVQGLRKFLSSKLDMWTVKLIEDVIVFAYWFARSRGKMDTSIAVVTFLKLRMESSFLERCAEELFGIIEMLEGDSVQGLEEGVNDFRKILDNWEDLKKSSLGVKYWKIVQYMIRYGIFQKLGVPSTVENHKALNKVTLMTVIDGTDFVYCVIDAVSLTLQRILIWQRTGKWQSLIHGESTYQNWFDECLELKRQYLSFGDLEAVGTNYFEFTSRLKQAIDDGESIVNYAQAGNFELRSARALLNDMKILDMQVLSRKMAQETRPAPFAMLVFGGSSVAKTTFSKILFTAYANYRHLPKGDEYFYTRDSKQKHWSNFSSYKWCVRMDDVAYMAMNNQMDPTMDEFLSLLNNVPFVPEMAAVEDKGRNPVRAELVIATTNNKTLSADQYFYCPFAIMRRVPWVITLTPAKGMARDDAPDMVDPIKLGKEPTDEWPNFWNIVVEKVVPADGKMANNRQMGKHTWGVADSTGVCTEEASTFTCIDDFLDWYKVCVTEYTECQSRMMLCDREMMNLKICENCNRPEKKCQCERLQGDEEEEEILCCLQNPNERVILCGTDMKYEERILGSWTPVPNHRCSGSFASSVMKTQRGEFVHVYVFDRGYVLRSFITPKQEAGIHGHKESEGLNPMIAQVIKIAVRQQKSLFERVKMIGFGYAVRLYFGSYYLRWTVSWLLHFEWARSWTYYWIMMAMEAKYGTKVALARFGKLMQERACSGWLYWLGCCSMCLGTYAVWRGAKKIMSASEEKPTWVEQETGTIIDDKCSKHNRTDCHTCWKVRHPSRESSSWDTFSQDHLNRMKEYDMQARSVDDDFFEKTEKENPWKKVDRNVTSFDLDPMQLNYGTLDTQVCLDAIRRNVRKMYTRGAKKGNTGEAIGLGGHLFVTCNHLMPVEGDVTIRLVCDFDASGVSRNTEFVLEQTSIYRLYEDDLAFFECHTIPPMKDLEKLIAKPSFQMGLHRGSYVGFTNQGTVMNRQVKAIQFVKDVACEELQKYFSYWTGCVDEDTETGDCGTPLILTGRQVILAGLHQRGGYGKVYAVTLNTDHLIKARRVFTRTSVQGGVPMIQATGAAKRVFVDPSHKSPLNWIQKGQLNFFGHFGGFKSAPRSKVCDTIAAPFLKARGWATDFVAPKFDWRPYNIMYNEIFGMKHNVKQSILTQARKGLSADLIRLVPKTSLAELKKVSWDAALNGIDGVQYVDKINKDTSMGFPWNCSKRNFLTKREDGKDDLAEHVVERAKDIERRYQSGVCAHPVFSAQVKDEPRKQKKVDAGMLRIFMGGPIDWSLVVRRYLISFIRCVQMNKMIFEAAIACVTQSIEWTNFHAHLTQFGEDRIVAGDFGKFDKHMSPLFILEAFEVIIDLLRHAGWDEEDLRVIRCIAEDTAYPTANVLNDLVQFIGTNPSGHPLTVIINSLVNALYMRYCYIQLNPERECVTFKQRVALLTYGDDNVMGVSLLAPWFNHTALVAKLAEIGVEYTMADKESLSVPYINIREVAFLKRTWVWNDELNAYLCPLEEASLTKMLMVGEDKGNLSPEAWIASKALAYVNEYFMYGRERFEQERAFAVDLLKECDAMEEHKCFPFPKWDDMVERFVKASA